MLALLVTGALAATPPAERSTQAAERVVRRYYHALARHDYVAAHAIWSNGHTLAALRRGYAHTRWTTVTTIPPFVAEGAAGSVYAEIRVRVDARLDDGTNQHFAGAYTLRRIDDVDGSTAAQRRWHIIGATLRPRPAGR